MPKFYVAPCAKVRQTQSDRWKKRPCVVRYRAFADRCRELKMALKDHDSVIFYIEMPESWSQKKRATMDGQPHRQRPDLDNLVGGLMDAIMPESDSHISALGSIRKVWSHKPAIEICNPYSMAGVRASPAAGDEPKSLLGSPSDLAL